MAVRVRVPLAALILKTTTMQKKLIYTLSACSVLVFASCSKMGPLSADNFTVTPNPLESQAGDVPATISGMFPEKYMKKKATVTVTPELRYANGQVAKGESATFQGEKVMGNNQTISYRLGGRYTMKTSFDYVPEMQQSELYLTFDARKGNKKYDVPAVKVATGVISTSELYRKTILTDGGCIAPDSFQRVREKKQEANIKFLINQAHAHQRGHTLFLHGDSVQPVRLFHRSPSVGDDDELGVLRQLVQITGEPAHVAVIQSRLNLVQQAEGRRLQILDGEQQRNGGQRLFSARQLHHILQLFPRRLGNDTDPRLQDVLILQKLQRSLPAAEQFPVQDGQPSIKRIV